MPFTTQVFNEVGPIGLPFDANMSVRRYVVPWNHGNGSSLSSRSAFSKSEYQKYSQNDSIIDSCTARNRWVFTISLPQSLLLVKPRFPMRPSLSSPDVPERPFSASKEGALRQTRPAPWWY